MHQAQGCLRLFESCPLVQAQTKLCLHNHAQPRDKAALEALQIHLQELSLQKKEAKKDLLEATKRKVRASYTRNTDFVKEMVCVVCSCD